MLEAKEHRLKAKLKGAEEQFQKASQKLLDLKTELEVLKSIQQVKAGDTVMLKDKTQGTVLGFSTVGNVLVMYGPVLDRKTRTVRPEFITGVQT